MVTKSQVDKPKIALAMIVAGASKDSAKLLEQALESIKGHVDGIFIQLNAPKGKKVRDDVAVVASHFTTHFYINQWNENFVEARNDVFSKVPDSYDWIMWMDVDDTIENPEQIRPVLSIMPKDIHGLYTLYDYDHDEFGNTTISHWVCRAVRNNGTFTWKSSVNDDGPSVHETLVAKREVSSLSNKEWKVIHHADRQRREASLLRNIELLEAMYKRQSEKGEVDPRILFYLATHLYDAFDFQAVKELLYQYLKMSGWSEERSEAHVYMGKIMRMEENSTMAKTAFLLAIGENPKNSNAYLELARLEFENDRFPQALEFLRIATEIKQPITPMVQFDNKAQIYILMAECLSNVGGKDLDEAMKWVNKALKLRPYDPQIKGARDKVKFLIDHRDNMKAANRLIRELEKDEEAKILPLLDALPSSLNDTPPVISARQHYTKPRVWPKKSIVIYTGNSSLGIWGPWSLNEGGIGGSEEAVIRLSTELAKLGWYVTIYGTPGERAGYYPAGDDDPKCPAIEWKQYWELNPQDEFNVLISWRQPAFFDVPFKAKKKYLWLHDVMPKEEFTKERIDAIDRFIFVSEYHGLRPEFDSIPQTKKFISSNGISSGDFTPLDGKFERNLHRCIYMSANERGLRILYDIWPEVRKAVPDAILDVYYGWESFMSINRDNPERMMWMVDMQQKAKELEGVTERGRIGQDKLNEEIFKSGVWAYPSFFPEVNCITGQKAMAGGAIPITSDFAALKGLVSYGEQINMGNFEKEDIERYKEALIDELDTPWGERERKEMMEWARDKFDWKNTAVQWDKEMS